MYVLRTCFSTELVVITTQIKKTTLDSLHCPVDLDEINDNRLLIIEDETITFIYEEVTLETIH